MINEKDIKLLMEENQELVDVFMEFQKKFINVLAKYMVKRRKNIKNKNGE